MSQLILDVVLELGVYLGFATFHDEDCISEQEIVLLFLPADKKCLILF